MAEENLQAGGLGVLAGDWGFEGNGSHCDNDVKETGIKESVLTKVKAYYDC